MSYTNFYFGKVVAKVAMKVRNPRAKEFLNNYGYELLGMARAQVARGLIWDASDFRMAMLDIKNDPRKVAGR